MVAAKSLLFVYGTLKRGERNHHRMGSARFVAHAKTEARYRVVDLGPYPGLLRDDATGFAILGEIWELDGKTLAELDEFEGEDFRRALIALVNHGGVVEAYFFTGTVPAGSRTGNAWPFPPEK